MYDLATRKRALTLVAQGRSLNSVSKQTGISRWCLRAWQQRLHPAPPRHRCPRCAVPARPPDRPEVYAYLLGLYLGDGCVSRVGRTYSLRIACAESWPGLITACEEAVRTIAPTGRANRVRAKGCVHVSAYSNHWPCLFPQHGPGRKHERRILLEPWQREIVTAHPWELIRGLVHSDGCRITNWTTRTVRGVRKRYTYPRYLFTNRSDDILRLFTDALDAVGVGWRSTRHRCGGHSVSIARRPSVALMDARIGPKR
ncbi:transcriptional regulator [Streptomyces sp. NHF165]|uniref:transcriptional regulator n=1 Tax=Streptomyces TaxID=1883 RepID=UPI00132EFA26|nr:MULTISPECIES: transcriptional regulator [Streptomyces]QHF94037.1 transcriptional regulator [Streptomyces sp. NHF165]